MGDTVVLGFSGGVDSAAAAVLLTRAGYEVVCLYLDVGLHAGLSDARAAAERLSLPLTVRDAKDALESHVCKPFLEGYLRGETINPCLVCNPTVKIRALADCADELGAKYIATGHYALQKDGAVYMNRTEKDQSYQLCLTPRALLSRLLLPLGAYEKSAIRALALDAGLALFDKPDSMDICFIPDHDYAAWIERRGFCPPPGDAVFDGAVVGRHAGIHRYTVGQRWGETYNGRRLYVSRIDPETNTISLALWDALFQTRIEIAGANWLIDPPDAPFRGRVRARHTRWETPDCTVTPAPDGAIIVTDTPLRAPAPGQAAAIYIGDRLVGGGLIKR